MENNAIARARVPDVQTAIPGTGVAPKLSNKCCVCGRRLGTEQWARLGIGPVCAKRNPHLLEQLRLRDEAELPVVPEEDPEERSPDGMSHMQVARGAC